MTDVFLTDDSKINLKQAFHYENKLKQWLNTALEILGYPHNIMTVKKTLFYSKADSSLQDETQDEDASNTTLFAIYKDETPDQYLDFTLFLVDEIKKLTKAIRNSKDYRAYDAELHVDDAVYVNKLRRNIISTMNTMLNYRDETKTMPRMGIGYRLNANGEETIFHCDMAVDSKVNYDRQKLVEQLTALRKTADKDTQYVEKTLITCTVEYVPPIDESLDVHDALQAFLHLNEE